MYCRRVDFTQPFTVTVGIDLRKNLLFVLAIVLCFVDGQAAGIRPFKLLPERKILYVRQHAFGPKYGITVLLIEPQLLSRSIVRRSVQFVELLGPGDPTLIRSLRALASLTEFRLESVLSSLNLLLHRTVV